MGGCYFNGPGAESLGIGWINAGLNQQRRMKSQEGLRACGLWIHEVVGNSRNRVAPVSLGLLVKVWKVRAIVYSKRPKEMEFG